MKRYHYIGWSYAEYACLDSGSDYESYRLYKQTSNAQCGNERNQCNGIIRYGMMNYIKRVGFRRSGYLRLYDAECSGRYHNHIWKFLSRNSIQYDDRYAGVELT